MDFLPFQRVELRLPAFPAEVRARLANALAGHPVLRGTVSPEGVIRLRSVFSVRRDRAGNPLPQPGGFKASGQMTGVLRETRVSLRTYPNPFLMGFLLLSPFFGVFAVKALLEHQKGSVGGLLFFGVWLVGMTLGLGFEHRQGMRALRALLKSLAVPSALPLPEDTSLTVAPPLPASPVRRA